MAEESERRCEHCGAELPPLPPIPQPPPARAKAAKRREHQEAMRSWHHLARPYCGPPCELAAAAREDEEYLRRLGMRPLTREEQERLGLNILPVAAPRPPKRPRSERAIARERKLYDELMEEMADEFASLRRNRTQPPEEGQ